MGPRSVTSCQNNINAAKKPSVITKDSSGILD